MVKKSFKRMFKRRKKAKTDYKARLALLKSDKPRIVIRKTNKYIIAQVVESKEAQDFTICYVNSKELSKFGWNLSYKNLPAAYLTGFLIAQKAKKKGIKKLILDSGLYRSTHGSKIYATVKGVFDGGIEIKYDSKIMPKEERILGKYCKNPEKINEIFNEIKEKIKQH